MKIKTITKYNIKCTVHNIGVLDDESYIVEGIKVKNCRGIWVEILIDEENKPKITGVPNSLRSRIGDATNELLQPRKPIIKKTSAAAKAIDKGKAGQ